MKAIADISETTSEGLQVPGDQIRYSIIPLSHDGCTIVAELYIIYETCISRIVTDVSASLVKISLGYIKMPFDNKNTGKNII